MYAVIFRAKIATLDNEYYRTVERLRRTAFKQYGCLDFISLSDGDHEVTISYWETEDQIKKWKQDVNHVIAQKSGQHKWYKSYQAQVAWVTRLYDDNGSEENTVTD